jgi:hypothetical protein
MIRSEILPLIPSSVGVPMKTLFWGQLPDDVANCIAFFEYLGEPPARAKDGMHYTYHALQVTVRDVNYDTAMNKAVAIFNILGDAGANVLGQYDYIRARQYPFADPSGKDENGRFRVLCNYTAKRRTT